MAGMKTITLTVEPDGTYTVDMDGFNGQGCEELLRELTAGDKTLDVTKKPEFYQRAVQQEKARS